MFVVPFHRFIWFVKTTTLIALLMTTFSFSLFRWMFTALPQSLFHNPLIYFSVYTNLNLD